jgi:uncharacterized repeat protein (TIGR03803 family)
MSEDREGRHGPRLAVRLYWMWRKRRDLTGWGGDDCRTVFELSPQKNGQWTEKVLHRFLYDGKDGSYPRATFVFDESSNLYGTTSLGGISDYGTVFEFSLKNSKWIEKVLHSFNLNGQDGASPMNGPLILVLAQADNR